MIPSSVIVRTGVKRVAVVSTTRYHHDLDREQQHALSASHCEVYMDTMCGVFEDSDTAWFEKYTYKRAQDGDSTENAVTHSLSLCH